MKTHNCRACGSKLEVSFVDLGMSPLSNSYIAEEGFDAGEQFFPLHPKVCASCFLVQLPEFETPENIFSDYAYLSSYSPSWLQHCKDFAYSVRQRFELNSDSLVMEVASNDGYLLKYFIEQGLRVRGVEPARNVANIAINAGVPTEVAFFGVQTAKSLLAKGFQPDLLCANNVLAHVPDIVDFVSGMKAVLKPTGVISMEFPHLLKLMQLNQFDTIYHEHFSYLSLISVQKLFERLGLQVFDVQEIPTHGGSLRIFASHRESDFMVNPSVSKLLSAEREAGLDHIETYKRFADQAVRIKMDLLDLLIQLKREHKTIAGYGAPAKGNTLLNFCGIRTDFVDYTVDRNPLKQGKYLPGVRIPINPPSRILETKPDYVLILPWNLRSEIVDQLKEIRTWGGKFITPIPKVEVF